MFPRPLPALKPRTAAFACLCALLFMAKGAAQTAPSMRTWTDIQGRTMQAALTGLETDHALFLMADGKTVKFPLSKLSPTDQAFVKSSTPAAAPGASPAASSTAPATAAAPRTPIEKRTWPDIVEVPSRSIEIAAVEEKPLEKRCIYRSEAFEFASEDKLAGSVMKEIARTFEATRALLVALPWGMDPKPPLDVGRFQAKFYETRRSYEAAGWPSNSGGVYSSGDRTFHIPFQSLGLEMRGKTWFKDENYRNDTIIHEITHQLMHDYLSFLPLWVIEGAAEYTNMLPYKAGKFQAAQHLRGLKTYLADAAQRGLSPSDLGSLQEHMNMKEEVWQARANGSSSGGGGGGGSSTEQHRLYFSSCLMVYYFCHLDGDGKGTRFLKYLDKMAEARAAWNIFFASPHVKHDKEAGRYSWDPAQITKPTQPQDDEYGLSELPILLDGRTPEQLETAVKEAYKTIGVKW